MLTDDTVTTMTTWMVVNAPTKVTSEECLHWIRPSICAPQVWKRPRCARGGWRSRVPESHMRLMSCSRSPSMCFRVLNHSYYIDFNRCPRFLKSTHSNDGYSKSPQFSCQLSYCRCFRALFCSFVCNYRFVETFFCFFCRVFISSVTTGALRTGAKLRLPYAFQ